MARVITQGQYIIFNFSTVSVMISKRYVLSSL